MPCCFILFRAVALSVDIYEKDIFLALAHNGEDEEEVVEHSADASRLSRSIKVVKTRR